VELAAFGVQAAGVVPQLVRELLCVAVFELLELEEGLVGDWPATAASQATRALRRSKTPAV